MNKDRAQVMGAEIHFVVKPLQAELDNGLSRYFLRAALPGILALEAFAIALFVMGWQMDAFYFNYALIAGFSSVFISCVPLATAYNFLKSALANQYYRFTLESNRISVQTEIFQAAYKTDYVETVSLNKKALAIRFRNLVTLFIPRSQLTGEFKSALLDMISAHNVSTVPKLESNAWRKL